MPEIMLDSDLNVVRFLFYLDLILNSLGKYQTAILARN